MHPRHFSISLVILSILGLVSVPTFAEGNNNNGGWVGTWAASPFAQPNKDSAFAKDTTLRQIVHVSAGGSAVRVILTNEFGTTDLKIGGAALALPASVMPQASGGVESTTGSGTTAQPTSAIQPGSTVPVRFGGEAAITIAPGAIAVSDPVTIHLAPQSDL